MKYLQFIAVFSFLALASCQNTKKVSEGKSTSQLVVGFYNVENLFDTIDDPRIDDAEFLPSSEKKYNTTIYNEKLAHLAKVISEFKPDVLGLCEVENKGVLIDLCSTLKAMGLDNYEVSHEDSPDKRGIDVAYIYNSTLVNPIELVEHYVALEGEPDFATRDIIQLTAQVADDTLYFFANHWPSRSGGQEASNYKRVAAARTLYYAQEDLRNKNPKAKMITMGDFNDEPFNESIAKELKADATLQANSKSINLSAYMVENGEGTYNYKGKWNVLDQIIVSNNLLESSNGWHVEAPQQAQVVKKDYMLYETKSGEKVPSRSYGGPNYYGGYSDHLPTYIVLVN